MTIQTTSVLKLVLAGSKGLSVDRIIADSLKRQWKLMKRWRIIIFTGGSISVIQKISGVPLSVSCGELHEKARHDTTLRDSNIGFKEPVTFFRCRDTEAKADVWYGKCSDNGRRNRRHRQEPSTDKKPRESERKQMTMLMMAVEGPYADGSRIDMLNLSREWDEHLTDEWSVTHATLWAYHNYADYDDFTDYICETVGGGDRGRRKSKEQSLWSKFQIRKNSLMVPALGAQVDQALCVQRFCSAGCFTLYIFWITAARYADHKFQHDPGQWGRDDLCLKRAMPGEFI